MSESISSVVYAKTVDQSRLRTRTVDPARIAADAARTALAEGRWAYEVDHGGDVANAYGYPAMTSACLAVSDPHGRTTVWMARVPANKVTLGGAADACLAGTRPLFDARYRDAAKRDAAEKLMRVWHAAAVMARARN